MLRTTLPERGSDKQLSADESTLLTLGGDGGVARLPVDVDDYPLDRHQDHQMILGGIDRRYQRRYYALTVKPIAFRA